MKELIAWNNFYVIVGSSAGALIGLQFVVMTLISDMPTVRGDAQANNAFATPSLVHFGAVLLLTGILSAPWDGIAVVASLWGLVGISGIVYSLIVARRMRVQTVYKPVFEDWLFHLLLPFIAYLVLAISAYAAYSNAHVALFFVGAAALLLLFIGIHNAWDTITHLVFVRKQGKG